MFDVVGLRKPIRYTRCPRLTMDSSNLEELVGSIARGEERGVAITDGVDQYDRALDACVSLGLRGGLAEYLVEQEVAVDPARPLAIPNSDDWGAWKELGVTPIHVDSKGDRPNISIAKVLRGAGVVLSFDRGPELVDQNSQSVARLAAGQTGVILSGEVGSNLLEPEAFSLVHSRGDLVLYNPAFPHMAITTEAPRSIRSIYFTGEPA
jgi:hypothetical protein